MYCSLLIGSKSTVVFWLVEMMGTFFYHNLANEIKCAPCERKVVAYPANMWNGICGINDIHSSSKYVEWDMWNKRHTFISQSVVSGEKLIILSITRT